MEREIRANDTLLVVEDEPLLLFHAVEILEDEGFEVLTAYSADAAIKLLTTRNDIRLVFTDVNMPGSMNGLKLALVIRDRWPPVELIITSGHVTVEDSELPSRGVFFSKPYRAESLVGTVRRLLS